MTAHEALHSTPRKYLTTFNLHSGWIWTGRLLPPSSPVLAKTFGLWYEWTQRVLLETVRVFKGEPLPVFPLGEHQFHHIRRVPLPEKRAPQLNVRLSAFVVLRDWHSHQGELEQGEGRLALDQNSVRGARAASLSLRNIFTVTKWSTCASLRSC